MKQISEQDIFDFVFFPEKLDSDEYQYISGNSKYADLIEYYKKLKIELSSELTYEEKTKITSKIPLYHTELVIPLFKKTEFPENEYRLVAASQGTKENIFESFIDATGRFIIRIAYEKTLIKLFPIFVGDIGENRYKIKIFPGELEKVIYKNSPPIEINTPLDFQNIQRIELTLA